MPRDISQKSTGIRQALQTATPGIPSATGQPRAVRQSKLERILSRPKSQQTSTVSIDQDELTQYLKTGRSHYSIYEDLTSESLLGTVDVDPLTFWKEHECEYPALASLARDLLSIPATGAGVERLFNSARDICHYRRGSLKASTIQDLMMYMCTTRFDIEEQRLISIKEFLTDEELAAVEEEEDAQQNQGDLIDQISDNEEDDSGSTRIPSQPTG
jgi:hypothetical protein